MQFRSKQDAVLHLLEDSKHLAFQLLKPGRRALLPKLRGKLEQPGGKLPARPHALPQKLERIGNPIQYILVALVMVYRLQQVGNRLFHFGDLDCFGGKAAQEIKQLPLKRRRGIFLAGHLRRNLLRLNQQSIKKLLDILCQRGIVDRQQLDNLLQHENIFEKPHRH